MKSETLFDINSSFLFESFSFLHFLWSFVCIDISLLFSIGITLPFILSRFFLVQVLFFLLFLLFATHLFWDCLSVFFFFSIFNETKKVGFVTAINVANEVTFWGNQSQIKKLKKTYNQTMYKRRIKVNKKRACWKCSWAFLWSENSHNER